MPINSKTLHNSSHLAKEWQRRPSLVLSTADLCLSVLVARSKGKVAPSLRSRKTRLAGGARLRSQGVGGSWRAAGWGRVAGRRRRGRQGKGRWRSRGGRSSLFVFVARWLPASHHVTRTQGRPFATSAAATASLRCSRRLRPAPTHTTSLAPLEPHRRGLDARRPQRPHPRHVTREPGSSWDAGHATVRVLGEGCPGVLPGCPPTRGESVETEAAASSIAGF